MNDSILSTGSAAQPTLGRIVANVVDMQHQLVTQFQSLTTALESMKLEHHTSIQSLREDLRRTDDRSVKQVDELRSAHRKEVERLMDLITTLIEKQKDSPSTARVEPSRPTPSQQAYAAASSPASFFGAPSQADYQRQALMMQQDPQMQMRMMMQMHQAQLQQAAAAQSYSAGVSQGHGHPSNVPAVSAQGTQNQLQSGSMTGGATQQSTPKVPIVAQTPLITPPKPSVGTVNLPSVAVPKPAPAPTFPISTAATAFPVSTAAATPKKEDSKPLVSTPAQPKPVISFGGFSAAGSPAAVTPVNLFGKSKGTTSTPEVVAKDQAEPEEDDKVEEYEPEVDFKPVIPLPELVDVVTGEEDEENLFECRAKLYRYFTETKEWKERGIGILKILRDPKLNRSRIVMRREQVHKVCANAPLGKGMTIAKMAKNEKAVVWMCEDFSEDEQTHMQLSARFGSVEKADEFIFVFEKEVAKSKGENEAAQPEKKTSVVTIEKNEKPAPQKNEKPAVSEKVEEIKTTGFGDKFKIKEGEWECQGCYTRQSASEVKCSCCGTNKDGSTGEKDIFAKSSIPTPAPGAPKFSFGLAAAAAAKEDVPSTTSTKSNLFGASVTAQPSAAPKFSFGSSVTPGSSPSTSLFGGSKLGGTAGSAAPSFSFAKAATSAATPPTTSQSSSPASSFSFKSASGSAATPASNGPKFGGAPMFGKSESAVPKAKEVAPSSTTPSTGASTKVFGSGLSSGLSFSTVGKSAGGSIFDKENSEAAQKQFAGLSKSKPLFSTQKEDDNDSSQQKEDDGEAADEEYEPDVEFKPVIPLPDLVDVVTGEENEEVLFKSRAKLYRWIAETKENKERGVGDLKILKDPATGVARVVMRREQVHKVCANFRIQEDIELKPKPNMPNVYQLGCVDYAEDANGSNEVFTIKFKNEQIAKDFHSNFVKAQASS